MYRRFLLLAAGLLALGGLAIGQTSFTGNTETFDGAPSAPLAWHGADWDVQVHERGSITELPAMQAQHGADCSAPPASHPNSSFEGSVFQCSNHLMTAINGPEYGVIYLTPNRLLDFSGEGVVSFDLSTERMSGRDWWDITVSPFADAQALPLLSNLSQGVDLQEPNRNSVVIATDNGELAPSLKVVRNGAITDYGNSFISADGGIAAGTNQAAVRQPFKLTLSPTHVRFERLASATGDARVFVDQDIPALSWTSGVVQLGHHSYSPEKDGAGSPATWHWDTVSVSPSTPFHIAKADQRALFDDGTVTFPTAPEGAYLRFSALCRPRVNGVLQTKMTDSGHPEHASSYMVAIPAGSTSASVVFEPDDWYTWGFGIGCLAKDFHVWAPPTSATPSPAATNTPPAATNTPTVTPPPTSTPTATPATYRCQRKNPNGSWTTVWTQPGGRMCP